MKNLVKCIVLLMLSSSALAIDTNGYVKIKEIKAWASQIDVYLDDLQEHQCSDTVHKTRFKADPTKTHYVSFLLMAFAAGKEVKLAYSCDEGGYPIIAGVRVH